jgi:hypothetical protein
MNILLTKANSYFLWTKDELYEYLGLITEHHVAGERSSPVFYRVNDKHKFFLAVIQYGVEFKELSDDDIKRRKEEYLQEIGRRRSMLRGAGHRG